MEPNSSEKSKQPESESSAKWPLRVMVSIICGLAPMLLFQKSTGGPQIVTIISSLYLFIMLSGISDYCITHPRSQRNTTDCISHIIGFTVVMTIITVVAGIGACFANLKI